MLTISNFQRYFSKEGLSQNEMISIQLFLREFVVNSKGDLGPGYCTVTPIFKPLANIIRKRLDIKDILGEIEIKRCRRVHYFLSSKMSRNRNFIIDPAGVPGIHAHQTMPTIPYFGLREHATGNHQVIYSEMEHVEDWSTWEI